jgi:transposase
METERVDVQKLAPHARQELRPVAVQMYRQGRSIPSIARDLGLRIPTVSGWIGKAQQGQSLTDSGKGRPLVEGRRLTPEQEARIRQEIIDWTPDQVS